MSTFGGFLTPGADPIALKQADSKLLKSYLNATEEWRGGNFFAEFGETVEMLLHPLRSVYRRTWTFVGRLGKLRKIAERDPILYGKLIANLWLGFVFGVKPLISDINDFTETLTRYQSDYKADVLRIGAHGYSRTSLVSDVVDVGGAYPIGPINSERTITKDGHVFYKGAVGAAPSYGKRTLAQFGFDEFDIIPAVWEAIPLSFLLDYFLNVQEVLDSMRYWKADLRWLQQTVRNSCTMNYRNPTPDASLKPFYSVTVSDSGFYASAAVVTRTAVGSLPYPGWQFKHPAFSSLKWLNVAALATQWRKTKPRDAQTVRDEFIASQGT
jgi:hypothetical protein